tara:strand:+ start:1919 stop:2206 length:288 start_codon:yes stop_codon:yes gene_type:complete
MSTPYFDFGEISPSKNKFAKIYPQIDIPENKTSNQTNTTTISWASIVIKQKPKSSKTYLYNYEVDDLVKKMNWGDFECMMDDVIIVPDGQPKPKL